MVLTVNTGRDDAMSLLRRWAEAGTLLRCQLSLIRVSTCVRVRIRALSAEQVELLSDDTFNEVTIPLSADLDFGTGDFRREAPDLADTYDLSLTFFIPVPNDPEHPESISLIEVKEDDEEDEDE